MKFVALLLLGSAAANAADSPLPVTTNSAGYQLGIGLGYSQLPDYPGADSTQHYLLPLPYFRYKSERLEVSRNGALGSLATLGNWSLKLSLAAALPTNSNDHQARAGMPDLLWLTEIGPTLDYPLSVAATHSLSLHLPLRKAIATNLRQWQDVGWRFEPHIRLQKSLSANLSWSSQLGLNWSNQRYHQYLYGVDSRYVQADRPYFEAASGYAGWRFSNGLSWQKRQWWLGTFVRYDNLQHTQFDNSPLLRRHHSVTFGIAVARIFKQQGDLND